MAFRSSAFASGPYSFLSGLKLPVSVSFLRSQTASIMYMKRPSARPKSYRYLCQRSSYTANIPAIILPNVSAQASMPLFSSDSSSESAASSFFIRAHFSGYFSSTLSACFLSISDSSFPARFLSSSQSSRQLSQARYTFMEAA